MGPRSQAPSRLGQTFEYDDEPGNSSLDVLTCVGLRGGRSRIYGGTACLSVEDRDAKLDLARARGEDFDQPEELLAGDRRR